MYDYDEKAQDYVDRVLTLQFDGKSRALSVDEKLQIAQIYATLAVAEELNSLRLEQVKNRR